LKSGAKVQHFFRLKGFWKKKSFLLCVNGLFRVLCMKNNNALQPMIGGWRASFLS